MMKRIFLLMLVLAEPVWAAEEVAGPSLLGSSLKMVAALAVVVGILLLLYAATKKGFPVLPQRKDGLIKVLETRPLGGRKFLCVVRVRDEELLLGLSHDRIECLTKLQPDHRFSDQLRHLGEEQS